MTEKLEIEVHLYGKLRQITGCLDPARDCVLSAPVAEGATIAGVLAGLDVPLDQTSNIFLNGQLSKPTRRVNPGDRLGVFPDDMATLYKWYFARRE